MRNLQLLAGDVKAITRHLEREIEILEKADDQETIGMLNEDIRSLKEIGILLDSLGAAVKFLNKLEA